MKHDDSWGFIWFYTLREMRMYVCLFILSTMIHAGKCVIHGELMGW